MKMQGYNGSQAPSRPPPAPPLARARAARALTAGGARAGQAWDTSFAMQAVLEAGRQAGGLLLLAHPARYRLRFQRLIAAAIPHLPA